jgi:hypothetical protein
MAINTSKSTTSLWVCDCDCHKEFFKDHMWHCMPCCHVCPTCDARIVAAIFDDHVRDCKTITAEFDKVLKRMCE